MKRRRRSIVVYLLLFGQVACFLVGLAGFSSWLRYDLTEMMRTHVQADNELIAAQLARLILETTPRDERDEAVDWDRIQRLVEGIALPNGGFVCVVDSQSGQIRSHPKLRLDESLRTMRLGHRLLNTQDGQIRISDAKQANGWVELPDGVHLVGVADVPQLKAKVLAHQHENHVVTAVMRYAEPARRAGVFLCLVLAVLSGFISYFLIWRHGEQLATANAALTEAVQGQSKDLVKTRDAVVFGLAKLAENRDNETGVHLERIQGFVCVLAEQLQASHPEIDEKYISMLRPASSLHDIGKVGIPDEILLKPDKLTDAERIVMEQHTLIGSGCLMSIRRRLGSTDFLEMACDIALAHHERWDGKGYPHGLSGQSIPLAARIVAVADVYDALVTRRVYKEAMTHEDAAAMIVTGSGNQLDPEIVDAFRRCDARFREITESQVADELETSLLNEVKGMLAEAVGAQTTRSIPIFPSDPSVCSAQTDDSASPTI